MNSKIQPPPSGYLEACMGCGACVPICPQGSIAMQPDAEGFLYPYIDEQLCNDCGLCRKTCPVNQQETFAEAEASQRQGSGPLSVFAAWHLDESIRCDSSSGGVFTALAESILAQGGSVMGIDRIVENGYCIGCGACAVDSENDVSIPFDEYGKYQADVLQNFAGQSQQKALAVCPFSDESQTEDQIGERLFSGAPHDSRIGFFRSLDIGYVAEGGFREKATSGGIITWLMTELLATNKIDGVIHVKKAESAGSGCLFEYAISKDASSALVGAKSRYYPVEASKVLRTVRENPDRYAFVGVPCFVKAVRNLMLQDALFAERIKYCIGIVCGHMKSKAFADCFAWQAEIKPGELEDIDFRVKRDGGTAGDYAVRVKGGGLDITKRAREFLGSNWGHNFFRYEACDYCDDVLAETADIAVGDAWLPEYENDPKGNSIIVVRSAELAELFAAARQEGRLHVESATADSIAMSQSGGLRDRREGLAYRLYLKKKAGKWVPGKRVKPSSKGLSCQRKKIYAHRSYMGKMSHVYWKEAVHGQSLSFFEENMNRLIQKNNRLYRPFWMRAKNKLIHFLER